MVTSAPLDESPVAFDVVSVQGIPDGSYTSLQFGPDHRLYVSDRFGTIRSFEVEQVTNPATGAVTGYIAHQADLITAVADIPNHNDDGTLNAAVTGRQMTGILVTGTATHPVIYASSSDPRAGGFGQSDTQLDTNSGIISRLTWNGTSWDKVDLVRGLPRSEANHSTNGLALGIDPVTGHDMLYVAQGGNTNAGAPSSDFGFLNEYALSSAILSIDLTRLDDPALFSVHANGANSYVYDIPTVQGTSLPFGGLDGLNQGRLIEGGPVQVYSSGYRNPYDIVITTDGRMFTIDNGANAGTGGLPEGEGTAQVTNQIPTVDPNGTTTIDSHDNLEFVVAGSYAGHPNPTRANPGAGVLSKGPNGETWISSPAGNWPPVDPAFNFLSNDNFLIPGVEDKALTTWNYSTDGLDEYTSGAFGGAMKGDLVATSFDGTIYRIHVNADNTSATKEVIASGLNGIPLDITAQGDSDPFAGTMWIAFVAGSAKISVLVPRTASVDVGPTVTSVVASGAGITAGDGDLGIGALVTLTVNLSAAVAVADGTPTLLLNNGGVASYVSGSGSNALKFNYTVAAGQDTADLSVLAVHLNGATVTAPGGSFIVPGSGQSLTDANGHVFTFGAAYQGGDYHILRDGMQDGIGVRLVLVNGVVYDETASFGWFVDNNGRFVYQPTAPVLESGGAAANLAAAVTNPAGILQIDTTIPPPIPSSGPIVTSVVASGAGITAGAGDLGVGAVVTLTVNLSAAVAVADGTPTLLLNNGGVASYVSGSGSTALKFSYTVAAGQDTTDLAITAFRLNGATVTAPGGSFILPGSGQSLTDANGHVFTFGAAYQGGDYHILRDGMQDGIGIRLVLVNGVVYDETASFGWYADNGGHFVYQPTAPVWEGGGAAADFGAAVTNPAGILQIDTTTPPPIPSSGPTVTSVVMSGAGITAGAGDLGIGAVVTLTLNLSAAVAVADGTPTLLLNNGGVASYVSGSGSNALKFNYTVAAGQDTADLSVSAVHLNGATVTAPGGSFILPGSGQSLTDANGHVFTFGAAYQGGDYHILRDGMQDGIGIKLVLVNGVVYDETMSFGWYADNGGHFVYQPTAPVLEGGGAAADLAAAVTNPAGILHIDTTAPPPHPSSDPVVTSVVASGAGITAGDGDLGIGAVVTLTVNLSAAVAVAEGTPTLLLNNGGVANYVSGSGSTALKFTYTVAAGQDTTDLTVAAVQLNSATVTTGAPTITGDGNGSLTDANGHIFSFGAAYQGGPDHFVLRDGVTQGIGSTLVLVNGTIYDHTASYGWYSDHNGSFAYEANPPVIDPGHAADFTGAVVNPAGTLQITTSAAAMADLLNI